MIAFALPFIASGFGVGFIVGMTGVGGGSLMTPILVLLFGLHPATAVGTDLLYAAVTKTCGTAVHHIGHSVEWSLVALLAAGSMPASIATLLVLRRFDLNSAAASGPSRTSSARPDEERRHWQPSALWRSLCG